VEQEMIVPLEQEQRYLPQQVQELLQHIEVELEEDIQMEVILVDLEVDNLVDNLPLHLRALQHMLDKEILVEHDHL
jgi:hypothetical protein